MAKINLARQKIKTGDHERLIEKIGKTLFESKIAEMAEDEIAEIAILFDEWKAGQAVAIGMLRYYNGHLYECIQAHTTQADWTPDATPALWKIKSAPGVIPDWGQPAGGHDAYNAGDKVVFEGRIYESTIDANVWSPTAYPAGWTDLGPA